MSNNTGNRNTGDWNTGHWNTGDRNTQNWNTGDFNTGNRNTGHWNTGDRNKGNFNTGNRNTGNKNTGHWNTGDRNTGYCNTVTPEEVLVFNKLANRDHFMNLKKPSFFYCDLTKWIMEQDMSDKEKNAYPSHVTTGGYLKSYKDLKSAHIDAWEGLSQEEKKQDLVLLEGLPNFDLEVFKEIFGFDPYKDMKHEQVIEIEGKKYTLQEIKTALNK